MTTIDVQGQYVVHAGDSLSFIDETAFQFVASGSGTPSRLVNAGSVDAGFTSDGIAIQGTAEQGPAVFWNKAGATLAVSGGPSAEQASSGFSLAAPGSLVRNDGTISVVSSASAVGGWLVDSRIVNEGDIQAHGSSKGYGLIAGGTESAIVNHGSLHATGADALGLFLLGEASVTNDGSMIVAGGAGIAVGVEMSSVGADIRNAGLIQASNEDGTSIGIHYSVAVGFIHHLANSGTISADTAIFAPDPMSSELHIDNSGQIIGKVLLGGGDDLLRNAGTIDGDIDLGRGDDRYLGQHGQGDVVIYGADSADSLYGGAGDDLLYGDRATDGGFDGDDLLKGGHGHDSLHGGGGADTLVGGAGGDELTGDGGADTFLFAKVSDSAWSAPDLITDLEASDIIDLSGIDADTTQAGDQAFHLVGALSGQAGEAALSYDHASHQTRLELDVNGDGHADAVIAMSGDQSGFTGFVL